MNANVTNPDIKVPANIQEMGELGAKVKASNTYKHSWYVIMVTKEYRYHKDPIKTPSIYQDNITEEYAIQILHWASEKAEKEYNSGKHEYMFIMGNKYENYQSYKKAGGKPDRRAEQWEQIREKFWYMESWRRASAEG